MCGIAGFIGKHPISKGSIKNTLSLMKKRGPNNQTAKSYIKRNLHIEFLHSRLSIIDQSDRSNQPFEIDGYSLIFNGEIYNYLELKNDLIKEGEIFSTKSDTEVLLKLLIKHGHKALDLIDGMWAFAFFNKMTGVTMLARDPFSEKPLYYCTDNEGVYFGSCPSFICSLLNKKPRINYKKLEKYIRYGFKAMHLNSESFIENIFSIQAGSYIYIEDVDKLSHNNIEISKIKKTGDLNFDLNKNSIELKNLLTQSLNRRMRSDQPIAFLLSGGVDSTALAYIAKRELEKEIFCYSIGTTDQRYDESKNIDTITKDLQFDHQYIYPVYDAAQLITQFKKLSIEFMSPLPSQNYLLYSSLNEKISSDGFKVVIAGHGGDELFGGYILHHHYFLKSLINTEYFAEAKANFEDKVIPYLRNKNLKDIESFLNRPTLILDAFEDSDEIECYFNKQIEINSVKLKFLWDDYFKNKLDEDLFFYTLPQHTIASDQVSMYYSIENRSPYLSKDIYQYTRDLPNHFLMKKGLGKYILRKSMENLVPHSILYDTEKKGFNFEFSKLYIKDFNSLFHNLTKNDFLCSLIDIEKINALSDKDNISNAESKLLFRILNAKVFIDEIEKLQIH